MTQEAARSVMRDAAKPASAKNLASTLPLAEASFRQLRASKLSATPRNFEVCYAYAGGQVPLLNQIIDDTLTRNGVLVDADIEKLGSKFIAPNGISDQTNTVGSRMADEVEQILSVMDSAAETSNACSDDLDRVNKTLSLARKHQDLGAVVTDLAESVATMQTVRNTLQSRLTASQSEIGELRQRLQSIRAESQSDPLTGLTNRSSFELLLPKAMAEAAERNEALCLIMSDVDHFKAFNDTWGHLTGDQVLRLVAKALRENFRGWDIIARYGGEEFAVVLPKTALQSACTVADQLRRAVMSKVVLNRTTGKEMGRVTLSLGIASRRKDDTVDSLIGRADACLYAAKRNGRNRVTCETDPEYASWANEITAA